MLPNVGKDCDEDKKCKNFALAFKISSYHNIISLKSK